MIIRPKTYIISILSISLEEKSSTHTLVSNFRSRQDAEKEKDFESTNASDVPTLFFWISKIEKQRSCNAMSTSKGLIRIRLVPETCFFLSPEFWREWVDGDYTTFKDTQPRNFPGVAAGNICGNSRGRPLARNDFLSSSSLFKGSVNWTWGLTCIWWILLRLY